jgi:hypothetical protein
MKRFVTPIISMVYPETIEFQGFVNAQKLFILIRNTYNLDFYNQFSDFSQSMLKTLDRNCNFLS